MHGNSFIEECVTLCVDVVLYTTNGYQMHGKIVDESDTYIVFKENGKRKMVYKHAISTIAPA